MNIVVTGASGFVGSHLARHLQQKGHAVFGVVRSKHQTTPKSLPGVEILECDLETVKTFKRNFDILIHCAAEIPSLCLDPDYLFEKNVNINKRTFEAALEAGVTKFMFCSSMSAFGKISAHEVNPSTPICEPEDYGKSKLVGETMLEEIVSRSADIRAVSFRLPGVVGVGSHDNFLSEVVNNMLTGKAIEARNPDALFNNILPITDLCNFVEFLASEMPRGHRVLTLAASQPAPLKRVLEEIQFGANTDVSISFRGKTSTFLISSNDAVSLGYKPPDTLTAAKYFGQLCMESSLG